MSQGISTHYQRLIRLQFIQIINNPQFLISFYTFNAIGIWLKSFMMNVFKKCFASICSDGYGCHHMFRIVVYHFRLSVLVVVNLFYLFNIQFERFLHIILLEKWNIIILRDTHSWTHTFNFFIFKFS